MQDDIPRRTVLQGVAGAAAIGAAARLGPRTCLAARASIGQPPSGAWFGAYPGPGNQDPQVSYEAATMADRKLATWYRYYEITQSVPAADGKTLVSQGRTLVMSQSPSFTIPPATALAPLSRPRPTALPFPPSPARAS